MSSPVRATYYLVKPEAEKDAVTVVLIKGNPLLVSGLDAFGIEKFSSDLHSNRIYLITS